MAEKEELQNILTMLDFLIEDTSLPRNIRRKIQEAKDILKSEQDFQTKVSSAVQTLVQASEDVNMPMHGRTYIWDILTKLEAL
ncbi:MAG: UPF0147 family protein [Candidatus Micrarchaeota archaeon]|nr:UPF0147 family protein [Candidatus Micrarchaeota archaeon]